MAYKVVRIKLSGWRDKFKEAEDDVSFDAESFPELDDYLSTMEERGWEVVTTSVSLASSGVGYHMYVTLHQPEPATS